MTGWDHEFAVPFINEGHFRVTDPGPLRAPVLDFTLRRDEALDLIIETKTAPDAKSTAPEHPSGTVRIATECVSLENIGGVKVRLTGVIPYRVRTSTNYRIGQDEHVEEAKVHALEAVVRSNVEARSPSTGLRIFHSAHSSGRISSRQRLKPPRGASSASAMTASRFSVPSRDSHRAAQPLKSWWLA
jgi:hypothetical protein